MRVWHWIVIVVVVAAGSVIGGYFLGRQTVPAVKISIAKTVPGKPEIIRVPATDADRQACLDSIIGIKAEMIGDTFLEIVAADACKKNSLGLDLVAFVRPQWKHNVISIQPLVLAGYGDKFDVMYGGSVGYTRMVMPWFGVGGGLTYMQSAVSRARYAGAHANLLFSFDD